MDGEPLSLGELRGKFVLLHFWNPLDDNCLQELVRFKAMRDRFGKDDRLAMIGFCPVTSPNDVAKVIKEKGLSWPQVILRDRVADSILLEYDAGEIPKTFLIGPDGKLVAKELGDGIGEAVAKVLGQRIEPDRDRARLAIIWRPWVRAPMQTHSSQRDEPRLAGRLRTTQNHWS